MTPLLLNLTHLKLNAATNQRAETYFSQCLYLNPLQDTWFENIYAGIDLVGHKDFGFLDEALYFSCPLLVDHNTILARFLHLGNLSQ